MLNIFNLFDKVKSSADPLTNRKTVTRWLAELPNTDAAVAHTEISNALIRLRNQDVNHHPDSLDVLMALDEYAQGLQNTLCKQYVRNTHMSTAIESKLWQAIYAYYHEVILGYEYHINAITSNPNLAKLLPYLPVINLRALHNLGNLFKWRFFHYEQPDAHLWQMLHKLYQTAIAHHYDNQTCMLYADVSSLCSAQYVRALLLTQIHPSALAARQVEIADQWLQKWVHLVKLEQHPKFAQHHFYVDTKQASGAMPVLDQSYAADLLCWDAALLLGQLRRTKEEKQSTTDAHTNLPEYIKTLDYLELQWDPINLGKLRKSPRIPVKKILNVVHGFNKICTVVKDTEEDSEQVLEYDPDIKYAEMVDIQLYGFVTEATRNRQHLNSPQPSTVEVACENWGVEDESLEGYRTRVPSSKNDWLRLSRLVAVKTETDKQWKLATVRRLFRAPAAGTHAGMEIIAHKPMVLMLHTANTKVTPQLALAGDANTINADLPIPVLMTNSIINGQCNVIIDGAQYAGNRTFKVTIGNETHLVKLAHVLEKGDTWLHVQAIIS
ncbi:MAG: hypothetical protein HOP20_01940 [Sulfuriferula sp.]|nr:hypothetical protein [Sulfuriferula sp.]